MRKDLEWRPVVGYEGLYEVSNYGDVKSAYTNKILSHCTSEGYHYVALYKDGTRHNKQVHRLVGEAFLPNPQNYPILNHKDENRKNNYHKNLEWCTYLYNNTYNNIHLYIGLKLRGRTAHNKGKSNITEEGRERLRQAALNRSEETKQKMTENRKRRYEYKKEFEFLEKQGYIRGVNYDK